jgi:hypothetical protein
MGVTDLPVTTVVRGTTAVVKAIRLPKSSGRAFGPEL